MEFPGAWSRAQAWRRLSPSRLKLWYDAPVKSNTHGWIRVSGLVIPDASVGIYPHEFERRQAIGVRAALWAPTAPALEVENIDKTIDYDAIRDTIESVCYTRHYPLLETLIETMARALLERFPSAEEVDLEVEKPEAIPGALAAVAIRRDRRILT